MEGELGVPFGSVFELVEPEPVAAASIGQVYKARLVSNGDCVAIKIQRPRVEPTIGLDVFILRFWAKLGTGVLASLGRTVDLTSVIDDFGELIYREIDYRAEAANAQRFGELYASIPDVYVPKVYGDLTTSSVLTMEWVDGCRLVDGARLRAMGLDSSRLVDTLVQCSLRQMLEAGFFHADPHAGNLLATPDGKLAFLDFGMMSYVEPYQRYAIIEAVVHLVNRDFSALAQLYKRIGFIPESEDVAPIVRALEEALPDVLDASVGELNIKRVINSLGAVFYEYPFSLPPFYISLIRCLGVLEGLAIQVEPDFRIISKAYPYISSRLLTDSSPELAAALQKLLFTGGVARWDRLEQLMDRAGAVTGAADTGSNAAPQAIEKLVDFLVSDEGGAIREQLVGEAIEGADELGAEASALLGRLVRAQRLPVQGDLSSPRLATAAKLAAAVASGRGLNAQSLVPLARRLVDEPAGRQAAVDIAAAVSERALLRGIRALFSLPESGGVEHSTDLSQGRPSG